MADQKINITLAAIDKTKGAFGTITRSIGAVTSAVFSLKTAIVGVVGVGGIGLLVRNSLLATDTLGKTADKLGVTTKALGSMRYAAELTGVATQTTDMAMQRFTRRLSEAANGTGEAKGALQELNLDAEKLVRLPLDQQMLEVAGAFENVQSQSDRVRLAFKLFDSEGVALVNTLSEGKSALQGMFAEAENLGILMSTQAAKGVEEANDAFFRLQSLFNGIIDQIVAALAPALTALAEMFQTYLVEAIAETNGSIEKFGQNAAKYIVEGVAGILDVLAQAIKGFEAWINALEENKVWGKITQDAFGGMRTDLSLFASEVEDAADRVRALGDAIGKNNKEVDDSNKNKMPEQISMLQRVAAAFREATNGSDTLQASLNSAVKNAMKSTTDSLFNLVTGAKSAKNAFSDMARSIINDLIRMTIQKQVTDRIFGYISTALTSVSGSPAGGKAIGGSVQAGKPTVVGERGQELFIPHSSGSIVPANKLGSSETPVNVTLNISTGVAQTVRTEIQSMLPMITNATKAAIVDAKQRGGSFARAMS